MKYKEGVYISDRMNPQNSNLGQEISGGIRDIIENIRSGIGNSGQEISESITGLLGDMIDLFPFIFSL